MTNHITLFCMVVQQFLWRVLCKTKGEGQVATSRGKVGGILAWFVQKMSKIQTFTNIGIATS